VNLPVLPRAAAQAAARCAVRCPPARFAVSGGGRRRWSCGRGVGRGLGGRGSCNHGSHEHNARHHYSAAPSAKQARAARARYYSCSMPPAPARPCAACAMVPLHDTIAALRDDAMRALLLLLLCDTLHGTMDDGCVDQRRGGGSGARRRLRRRARAAARRARRPPRTRERAGLLCPCAPAGNSRIRSGCGNRS
jgi:hypothetical protein